MANIWIVPQIIDNGVGSVNFAADVGGKKLYFSFDRSEGGTLWLPMPPDAACDIGRRRDWRWIGEFMIDIK